MKKLKVVLGLITEDNDYQREQAAVAESTARRLDIDLAVLWAKGDAIVQTQQLLGVIHAPDGERPDAVVVEPVGTGMLQVATTAVTGGIGWVVLNRDAEYLAPLRAIGKVPVGCVLSDNLEVGRIQGRQFGALLPNGGSVLYIEGPAADVARHRRAGMEETRPANVQIRSARGRWTEESAYEVMAPRLQREASQPPSVDIVGCQNDAMAMGARKAVEALKAAGQREQWLKVPFTGCDGVPSTGQAWVQKKLLTATVVTPALTGMALELLLKSMTAGTPMPERTLTKALSYPSIEELRARSAARTPR